MLHRFFRIFSGSFRGRRNLQLDELIKQIETDKIRLENILETKNATTQLIE